MILKYKKYRKVGIKLNAKILKNLGDTNVLTESFQPLGVVENFEGEPTVIIDEGENDALSDYVLYELKSTNGKTLAANFKENSPPTKSLEKELLDSMIMAKTSLFEVVSVDIENNTLELIDLLNEGKSVTIIDIGFSKTVVVGMIFFTRILSFNDFNMTSGANFLFPMHLKSYVRKSYKRNMKKAMKKRKDEALNRFIVFFHINRDVGLPIEYK